MTPQLVNHREALGFWLNALNLKGEMAEIGCARGSFARTVLSQWKGKKYHMIDPWAVQEEEVYRERQPTIEGYEDQYQDCLTLAKDDERVNIIRELSVESASKFKKGQLDCAYIDGNHAYGVVMTDMDTWWPKVKIGGIMGGHDYYTNIEGGAWCEVEAAVKRWSSERNHVFYVCPCTSWFIHKTAP